MVCYNRADLRMSFGFSIVIPVVYVCAADCGNAGSNGNSNSEYFEEVQRNVLALHRVLQVVYV